MDERQTNTIKALVLSVIIFGILITVGYVFILPMEQIEREKIIQEKCPNGLEDCALAIDSSIIWLLLAVPPIIVYAISFDYFEKKRIKSWNSWK